MKVYVLSVTHHETTGWEVIGIYLTAEKARLALRILEGDPIARDIAQDVLARG